MREALLALPPVLGDTNGTLHQLMAQYGKVLYVGLAVLVVGLVAFAVVASGEAEDAERRRDRRLREEVLALVRLRATVTPEQVAATMQVDLMHGLRLLEELEREGLVVSSGRNPVQFRRVAFAARRPE